MWDNNLFFCFAFTKIKNKKRVTIEYKPFWNVPEGSTQLPLGDNNLQQ